MSLQLHKVVSLILNERFGALVSTVGIYCLGTQRTLLQIKKHAKFPLSKIKESICILIKYGLILTNSTEENDLITYRLDPEKALLMLRYPKFINHIKKQFCDASEALLELLLQRGCATGSELILLTAQRFKNNENPVALKDLKEKFTCLVTAKFIVQTPLYSQQLETEKTDLHSLLNNINLQDLAFMQNGMEVTTKDADIYWTINPDRFHQDFRDKMIVGSVSKKFDTETGELMRLLLQQMYIRTTPWAATSNPIPILEVKDLVKKQNSNQSLIAFFDQYLNILENDSSQIIQKVGEASGGSFQINLKAIINHLCWETVEQIVLEKFDSKAARIFHLIKSRQYIEPDQIQQLVMIPAKEVKRISYHLLEENFIHLHELKRTVNNSGPTKSFTLFYTQLNPTIRMLIEWCYKILFNIMTKRQHDKTINKRIIEKKQRVDAITLGMHLQGATAEQLADIEEMITQPESEILEKIGKTMKKLSTTELEIDDTLFLLQMYLMYEAN